MYYRFSKGLILIFFLLFSCKKGDVVQSFPTYSHGAVSTAHPIATQIGIDILKKGGNAFDAAVAVQFALAVVYPSAGNIAGGGFLVYRKSDGEIGSLDFREKAPLKATRDMYIGKDTVYNNMSREGILAVGVPGTIDGMFEIYDSLCSLPLADLMMPSILLAQQGYPLTKKEAEKINKFQEILKNNNTFDFPFLNETQWQENDSIRLPHLAETLERILENGREEFYYGKTADLIVKQMEEAGGIISKEDLAKYDSKWRTPIVATYQDTFKVITMPPPSAGGVALVQLLKGWEKYPVREWGHNSVETIHLQTELERRVYADRAEYLGDADFYPVPVDSLLDNMYLMNFFQDISMEEKTPSEAIKRGKVEVIESFETTHFSIVDEKGNAVAITTTLNSSYGSKVMVKEGGFFLNNEMDDFSIKPGVPNQFGLVGSQANEIVPQKRMLSSMTPTILEKNGKLFMVVGTPGGSTIITSIFQTIVNVIDFEMDLQTAINAKKTHSQWLPDKIYFEKGIDSLVLQKLYQMNHILETSPSLGRMSAILIQEDGTYQSGADYTRADNQGSGY